MNHETLRLRMVAALLALTLPAATISSSRASAATVAAAGKPEPERISVADVDRSADPCTDFDAFANGPWRAANPIPQGASKWSRRAVSRELNRQQLTALLQELSARTDWPAGSPEQELGDSFAACMNEPVIEAQGVAPLSPLLAEIAAVQDQAGIQRMIGRLHQLAVPAPFVVSGASKYHDPALVVVNVAAGGLGMPDREPYLSAEPAAVEARKAYQAKVARLLTLSGMTSDKASVAAAEIVALETRLAEAGLPAAVAADPAATAHSTTFAELTKLAPRVDWEAYFAEGGLPRIDLNVAEPVFLERLNRELEVTPVSTWKSYLTWHLLKSAGPSLSKSFADGASGSRAAACLESTETLLGEPLGRKYAERYFPTASKARVEEMVGNLLAVLKEDVRGLTWMSEPTKHEALAKLESYDVHVGYPPVWTDYSGLTIRRGTHWENVAAARRFGVDTDRKRIGRRVARDLWALPASSSGAYIDIQLNLMGLPAGFLQPWSFDPAASDAMNYGAMGAGIAHDLTHAIDALGAEFDSKGQPRKWWAAADLAAFQNIGQCTVDQYDGYSIEPGTRHQGKLVLGEAQGDLAGLRLAYRALQRSMKRRAVPTIDGRSAEQQFFIAWGQYRGAAETLDAQREMVKTDTHPTARYRVIGPLSNMPEFQQAFACKAGAVMVRPAAKHCAVW